jgi:competence protein ComEA
VKSVGGLFSGLAARLAKPVRAAAAWRWGPPFARAAVAVLGLVVLAAIGRSALAGGASKPLETVAEPRAPEPLVRAPQAPSATTPTGPALVAGPAPEVPSSSPLPVAAVLDAGEAAPRGRATPDDPVFLNQATLADLRRLPGVGDKRARAILALRDRLQHFQQIEDLLKVKGIGRASLKKLRPLVRLDLLALPEHPTEAGAMPQPP